MAFAAAKGDYVTFLGDDDGLAPQFFERVNALIEGYDQPDVIYSSLYQFMHPGVAPWQPSGYVADVRNGFFFEDQTQPFVLSAGDRRRAVEGSLSIRRNFTFNMQCFVFSRALIQKCRSTSPSSRLSPTTSPPTSSSRWPTRYWWSRHLWQSRVCRASRSGSRCSTTSRPRVRRC